MYPTHAECIPKIMHIRGQAFPDSKDHGANMGPTWVLSAPGGPHVGPMDLAIRVTKLCFLTYAKCILKIIITGHALLRCVFRCGLRLADVAHILQGYFIGTEALKKNVQYHQSRKYILLKKIPATKKDFVFRPRTWSIKVWSDGAYLNMVIRCYSPSATSCVRVPISTWTSNGGNANACKT